MVVACQGEAAWLPFLLLAHESVTTMNLDACKLVLEKLQSFALPDEARWRGESGLEPLTRLAASFTNELVQAGGGELLSSRSHDFERLTAPGSDFDQARCDAHNLLASLESRLYLPGRSPPLKPSSTPYRRRVVMNTEQLYESLKTPNDIPRIRNDLAQLARVRRHLPGARDDVERLLGLCLANQEKKVLQRWQREVFRLCLQCEQQHLYGAYLLLRCRVARDAGKADRQELHGLLQDLGEDPPHGAQSIQEAAAYLLARLPAEVARPTPGTTVGEASEGPDPAKWRCHAAEEKPTSEYRFGPLTGTLRDLAKAICPSFGFEEDPRAVKRLANRREIWVQKVTGHCYKVFLRDQKSYAEANARWMKIGAHKQAGKPQEQA
jgi:hypothetical protein